MSEAPRTLVGVAVPTAERWPVGRVIIPPPCYSTVKVTALKPGADWVSDDGVTWHRVLKLDLSASVPTITVGEGADNGATVECDPEGVILCLHPHSRPRR